MLPVIPLLCVSQWESWSLWSHQDLFALPSSCLANLDPHTHKYWRRKEGKGGKGRTSCMMRIWRTCNLIYEVESQVYVHNFFWLIFIRCPLFFFSSGQQGHARRSSFLHLGCGIVVFFSSLYSGFLLHIRWLLLSLLYLRPIYVLPFFFLVYQFNISVTFLAHAQH